MLGEGGMEVSEGEVRELGKREVVSTGVVVMSSGGAVSKYVGFKRLMDTTAVQVKGEILGRSLQYSKGPILR